MKKIIITILLVAVGAVLWWLFSPLLFDKEVQDVLDPEIAALLEADSPSLPVDSSPNTEAGQSVAPTVESPEDNTADPSNVISLPNESTTAIEPPTTVIDGPFAITGTRGHGATGEVRVIHSPDQSIVRYENYDGTNGPDLFVYLATDLEATNFVSLGDAKGNQGNINYEVPADVDLDDYKYVITWCKTFGVLFDYAEIN